MIVQRKIMTLGATLMVAAGIGHVMQNGVAFASLGGNGAPRLDPQAHALPTPPAEAMALSPLPSFRTTVDLPGRVAMLDDTFAITGPAEQAAPRFALGCAAAVEAIPAAGGMINIELQAPCHANDRIVVSHAGMSFADTTDGMGSFAMSIPALSRDAQIEVVLSNGETLQAQTEVFTLDGYARAVLQWRGETGFQLHARENGAAYGESGHIWAATPGDVMDGVEAKGGFLLQLGNPDVFNPMLAEVYSWPADRVAPNAFSEVTVEAEVTAQSCGTEASGRLLWVAPHDEVRASELTVAMPQCDAVGDYLLLKNLSEDLKLALNN